MLKHIYEGRYKYRFSITLFFVFLYHAGFCQDARKYIDKLSSPSFDGRGYYKNGDHKAALYIGSEFERLKLTKPATGWFQEFSMAVNTFPGKMEVRMDGMKLRPGVDFIVSPSCPSAKATFNVITVSYPFPDFKAKDYSDYFLLVDKSYNENKHEAEFDSLLKSPPRVKGIIVAEAKKLTWSVSDKVNDLIYIRVLKSALPVEIKKIKLNIENKFISDHKANNVIAIIPGTINADSFIVITAHYDHLGRMGKRALFPGANDNASGVAMLMELAAYYNKSENRIGKSILFIAFAGEEAGLLGSKYYTDNPPYPLNAIRFLINLDLMGNGQEGMMVVNGEIHPTEFSLLEEINGQHNLLKTIGKRGKARNSDHYWFSEQGVPSFFFYTMGGSTAYHDVHDISSAIELPEYTDIETLIKKFINVTGR